jgi:hypothetical protein
VSDNLPVKRTRQSDAEILRGLKHYLVRREGGILFHRACREAGIKPETVKRYRQDHPDFAEAEQVACAAGIELAEEVLKDKAMDGDYQSLARFLEANDEKYQRQVATSERQTVVIISADNALEKVQLLKEELLRRQRDIPEGVVGKNPFMRPDRQAPGYVDADGVEDAEIL